MSRIGQAMILNRQAMQKFDDSNPRACVHSGFCCKQAPCNFGEWDWEAEQCKFLSSPNEMKQQYCTKYDEIKNRSGAKWNPAFGQGCCSPLNEDRQNLIKKLRRSYAGID